MRDWANSVGFEGGVDAVELPPVNVQQRSVPVENCSFQVFTGGSEGPVTK